MKNVILPCVVLVVGASVVASACSSSHSAGAPPGPDLQACALLSSCNGLGLGRFGAYCELVTALQAVPAQDLETDVQLEVSLLPCVQAAKSCADLKACSAATPAQAAVCGGKTDNSTKCAGAVAVTCSSTPTAANCGAAGLVCGQGTIASCGTAPCTAASMQPQCNGDSLVQCDPAANVLQSTNCKYNTITNCTPGTQGQHMCVTHASDTCGMVAGQAKCVGTGAACDEATTPTRCDGTSIVSCTGGSLARFDCSSYGLPLTCKPASDGSVGCVGSATECDDTTPETCESGVITFCYLGTKTTANCKSYGFSGCMATTPTGMNPATAYCTP
jgi:hypothetical protein